MRRFAVNESGSIAVAGGLLVPIMLVAAAVALSFVDGYNIRTNAQDALDAAVLAGASAPSTLSNNEIIALADKVFEQNRRERMGKEALISVLSRASTKFDVSDTTVVGDLNFTLESPFLRVLGLDTMQIGVQSGAKRSLSAPICVLGLDPNEAETIDLNGKADVNLENCAALANSRDGSGLHQVGTARMRAKDIGVHGGYSGSNFFPVPSTGVEPAPDPLALVPEPIAGTCHPDSGATFHQQARALTPGTYCGGLTAKSSAVITLAPGVYIMKDGPLRIDSQAAVIGDEVMIAFQGHDATLEIYSGGALNVTSPTSGTYANIQFFGDRRTYVHNQNAQSIPPGQDDGHLWFTVIGDSQLSYDGIAYLPMHHMWLAGGSTIEGSSPSYVAIAKKLWFQDSTQVHFVKENKRGLNVDGATALMKGARLFR